MEIWVHRGRTNPEKIGNSLFDFMLSFKLNITGIEADVSLTTDGRPMIYHPSSTKPDLITMTWGEISKSIFDILPLSTFLSELKSYSSMPCCLDLKQNSEELVRATIDAIQERQINDKIFLTAFEQSIPMLNIESSGELLLLAKKIDPTIKTHIIALFPFNLPAIIERYHPDAISFGWLDDNPVSKIIFNLAVKPHVDLKDQVLKAKELGVKVWGGIVNDKPGIEYFTDLGVDGIMTENPELMLETEKIP